MRILLIIILYIGLFCNLHQIYAQEGIQVKVSAIIEASVVKSKKSFVSKTAAPFHLSEFYRDNNTGLTVKNDWRQYPVINPNAKPHGVDPVLQEYNYKSSNDLVSTSFEGISYTGVKPADPCIAVGPNHIIQVANSGQGSVISSYDKDGNIITLPSLISEQTEVIGGGDPVIFFDQISRRWVYLEMNFNRREIVLGISFNEDPYDSVHVYQFPALTEIDYPKIASFGDSYVITSHEDPLALYVVNKEMANRGDSTTFAAVFALNNIPGLEFYSASPVHVNGTQAPPSTSGPMIMRLIDDGWTNLSDRLEIYTFSIDWNNFLNSILIGPTVIEVSPFDTDLCGYNSYACVPQPNTSFKLDPLKEMLMHQVNYRNFGSYQSIVTTHTVDVDGSDQAGIRWYELQNRGQGWQLYQEGTFAPDNDSRFMGTINMNQNGDMVLAYNVSGPNTYPSMRFTGRKVDDPPGIMTVEENSMIEGRASNPSNRWGDYNVMCIDPNDQSTFWFNGMYTPKSEWSTRIGLARFPDENTVDGSPLSIQLVDFDTDTDNTSIHVEWESQNAIDFVGFELWRRSESGNNFQKVTYVPYGESNQPSRSFKYIDRDVKANELYYYKLKMIDNAGEHFWSNVIIDQIERDGILPVTVFPNPTDTNIFIEVDKTIDKRDIRVELYNMMGQKIHSTLKNGTVFLSIEMGHFDPGVYLIRVFQQDKLIHFDRISKI